MTDLDAADALLGDEDVGDYELGQDEEAELLRDDEDENEAVLSFQAEPLDEEDDEETERDKFANERQNNVEAAAKPREQNGSYSNDYRQRKKAIPKRGGRGQYGGGRGTNRPFNQANKGAPNRIGTGLCYIKPALLKGEWEKKPVQSVQPLLNNMHPSDYSGGHCMGGRYPRLQHQQPSGHYQQTFVNREVNVHHSGPHHNPAWNAPLLAQPKHQQPQGQYRNYNQFPPHASQSMNQNQQQFGPLNSPPYGHPQPPINNYFPNQNQHYQNPAQSFQHQQQQYPQEPYPNDGYQQHPQTLQPQQFAANHFQGGFNNQYNSNYQAHPPPQHTMQIQQGFALSEDRQVFQIREPGPQQFAPPNQGRFVSSPPRLPPYEPHPPQQVYGDHQSPKHSFNNQRFPPRNNHSQYPPRSNFNPNHFPSRGRVGAGFNRGYHQQFNEQDQVQNEQVQVYQGAYHQNQYKRRGDDWNQSDDYNKRRNWQDDCQREKQQEYYEAEFRDTYEEYREPERHEEVDARQASGHEHGYAMGPEQEEDEETKAYRLQIEEQKRKREEILAQKEKNRKLAVMKKSATEGVQRKPGQPLLKTPSIPPIQVGRKMFGPQGQRMGSNTMTCATNPNLRVIQRQEISASNNIQIINDPMKIGGGPEKDAMPEKFFTERKVLVKDDALLNTPVVVVRNLAASSSEAQLRKLCNAVGLIQTFEMSTKERQAKIRFNSVASAHTFYKKYQRYMLDLSMIQVELVAV